MAVTLSPNFENARFTGNPVLCKARADRITGAAFHRVCLEVSVSSSDGSGTFLFSAPTVGGEDVIIDVSSALQAVADNHRYTAQPSAVPSLTFTYLAYDEFMVDGQLTSTRSSGATGSGGTTFYAGRLSDMTRLYSAWPSKWSLKPTSSPEVVFTDYQTLTHNTAFSADGLTLTAPITEAVTVNAGFTPDFNIYGIPAPADGYELRFINSLGVHENVFVSGLPAEEVTMQTERYVISRQETLTEFSRGLAVKQNDHLRLKLSTGPLDRQWQHWYIHELLMARWVWIGIGPAGVSVPSGSAAWIPCHLLPDDTIPSRDRQKATPLTVQFTAELDINGSPLL